MFAYKMTYYEESDREVISCCGINDARTYMEALSRLIDSVGESRIISIDFLSDVQDDLTLFNETGMDLFDRFVTAAS